MRRLLLLPLVDLRVDPRVDPLEDALKTLMAQEETTKDRPRLESVVAVTTTATAQETAPSSCNNFLLDRAYENQTASMAATQLRFACLSRSAY